MAHKTAKVADLQNVRLSRIYYSRLDVVGDWAGLAQSANYSPSALASDCGVSIRQLQRYFLKKFGRSPRWWLNALRQREGLRILQSGGSVKEAAFHIGYTKPHHFSRDFKRHFGYPPCHEMANQLRG